MKCENCGKEVSYYESCSFNNKYYCEECYNKKFKVCECCGYIVPRETITSIGGHELCQHCAKVNVQKCDICGEPHLKSNSFYVEGQHICRECYHKLRPCYICGERHTDEHLIERYGVLMCEDCADDYLLEYHAIKNWIPRQNLHDKTPLKGFELEFDSDGWIDDRDTIAKRWYDITGDFCMYQRDGSLGCGIEVITQPFTTEYIKDNIDMVIDLLDEVKSSDLYDKSSCGLHIHVNRSDLTKNTTLSEEEVIDNILLIMEVFKQELTEFSRREFCNLIEWASFLVGGGKLTKKKIKDASSYHNRYRALNLSNDKTIEFRIFSSTTELLELMASIEIVDRIIELAQQDNLDGLTWEQITDYGDYLREFKEATSTVLKLAELDDE